MDALTPEEEENIIDWIENSYAIKCPRTKQDVFASLKALAESEDKSDQQRNALLNEENLTVWLEKHSQELEGKLTEAGLTPKNYISEEGLRNWSADVRSHLEKRNLSQVLKMPWRVFLMDVTVVKVDPDTKEIVEAFNDSDVDKSKYVTLLLTFSASGDVCTPMVWYPFVEIPQTIQEKFPKPWGLGRSAKGLMDSETYLAYFKDIFVPWIELYNIQRPVLLFVDAKDCHLSFELSMFLKEKEIVIYGLYPDATHIMEPYLFDVLRPLKVKWDEVIQSWKTLGDKAVTLDSFAEHASNAVASIATKAKIQKGFNTAGLYPFNPYTPIFKLRFNATEQGIEFRRECSITESEENEKQKSDKSASANSTTTRETPSKEVDTPPNKRSDSSTVSETTSRPNLRRKAALQNNEGATVQEETSKSQLEGSEQAGQSKSGNYKFKFSELKQLKKYVLKNSPQAAAALTTVDTSKQNSTQKKRSASADTEITQTQVASKTPHKTEEDGVANDDLEDTESQENKERKRASSIDVMQTPTLERSKRKNRGHNRRYSIEEEEDGESPPNSTGKKSLDDSGKVSLEVEEKTPMSSKEKGSAARKKSLTDKNAAGKRKKKKGENDKGESDTDNQEVLESPESYTSSTDQLLFEPGAKLEAKDYTEKWYVAKILEVNRNAKLVLIHFDKWSSRFDEWISMDSHRLRPLVMKKQQKKSFRVGQKVVAVWSDARRYPAKITSVLPDDYYEVLFYDGYSKRIKGNRISVMTPELEGKEFGVPSEDSLVEDLPPPPPPPPHRPSLFSDEVVGTKEERRERKRKLDVANLFKVRKHKNSDSESDAQTPVKEDKSRVSPVVAIKRIAEKATPKQEKVTPKSDSTVKRQSDSSAKRQTPEPKVQPKPRREAAAKQSPPNLTEFTKCFIDDPKLPKGWIKKAVQRQSGVSVGKWDIYMISPEGRKFRSRNEIKAFIKVNSAKYKEEQFDFTLGTEEYRRPISDSDRNATSPKAKGDKQPKVAAKKDVSPKTAKQDKASKPVDIKDTDIVETAPAREKSPSPPKVQDAIEAKTVDISPMETPPSLPSPPPDKEQTDLKKTETPEPPKETQAAPEKAPPPSKTPRVTKSRSPVKTPPKAPVEKKSVPSLFCTPKPLSSSKPAASTSKSVTTPKPVTAKQVSAPKPVPAKQASAPKAVSASKSTLTTSKPVPASKTASKVSRPSEPLSPPAQKRIKILYPHGLPSGQKEPPLPSEIVNTDDLGGPLVKRIKTLLPRLRVPAADDEPALASATKVNK